MFTQKTTKHPIETNSVPEKCWEETPVDLSGPLPSSHHVYVVQDLASRYPVAKIIKFKNAKSVIPVHRDTYDLFGNPLRQKSDNGPPFNSNEIAKFAKDRNIEHVKTPPGHSAANNVETVIKPLGKAMKIGNVQNFPELLVHFLHLLEILLMYQLEFYPLICKATYNSSRHTVDMNYKISDQVFL